MVLVLNSKNMNRMIYATVFFMFIMGFLVNDIGLPLGTMALLDVITVFTLLFSFRSFSARIHSAGANAMAVISTILLCVAMLYGLYVRVSIRFLLEGVRNSFRGMMIFVVAVCILQKQTINKIMQLIVRFFQINVVMCSVQAFVLRVIGDYRNGFFGTGFMNSWTNILLCVISIYYISRYMNRLNSLRTMVVNILLCFYVAILAELKAYFFEFVIIVMAMILLNRPSWRTFVFCLVGGLALSGMLTVFIAFWENNTIFTFEGLIEYFDTDRSYGYAAQGDWGRIGGIAKATKKFFGGDLSLLGMGLGYCGFDTPFYVRYERLHYNWFSYIYIFIEQGWIGIIGYISFFILNIPILRKKKIKSTSPQAKTIYDVSMIMSVLGIFLLFYNATVTGYPAFFLFLLMGIAYRYELDDGVSSNAGRLKASNDGQLVSGNVLHNSSPG